MTDCIVPEKRLKLFRDVFIDGLPNLSSSAAGPFSSGYNHDLQDSDPEANLEEFFWEYEDWGFGGDLA